MHREGFLFLLSLAVLLGAARILGVLAQRLRLPAVVGEILAGVFVGKTVLGRISPAAFDWMFREGPAKVLLSGYTTVAAVLLLVVAGLEIDLTVLRRSSRAAVTTSALGVVVPFALGWGVGFLLPDSDLANPERRALHAAFLGIALSISALPVIAKTLLDLGLLKTDFGLVVLSAAVVDDLVGWTSFTILARQFVSSGGGAMHIAISIALTLAFVVLTLVVVRPVVDRVLARMQGPQEDSSGRVLSMVMVLALLGGAATEALGMHAVFGGFVIGLAIGDSPRLREHTRAILREFVMNVFTPVFFATMALRYDFVASFDVRLVAIVLLIACVAKVAACTGGARLSGIQWREALAIGFGMNSRGAMEILLASLAIEANIISSRLFVALVVMAAVTSLLSGPAMSYLLRVVASPALELLRDAPIELDIPARTATDVIRLLARRLAGHLNRPDRAEPWTAAVLAREALAGTGIGERVAVPHAEVSGLDRPALAFARTAEGIDFNAPDGEPVEFVFLLLIPPGAFRKEVQVLAALARLVIRDDLRGDLAAASDARAVLAAFTRADKANRSVRERAA